MYTMSETHRYGLKNDCKTDPIKITPESPSFSPCFSCYCICAEEAVYSWDHEASSLTMYSDGWLYKKPVTADVENN